MSEIKVTPISINDARDKLNRLLEKVQSIHMPFNSRIWRGHSYDGLNSARLEVQGIYGNLLKVISFTICKLSAADDDFRFSDEELANMYSILGEEEVKQIINTDASTLDDEIQED